MTQPLVPHLPMTTRSATSPSHHLTTLLGRFPSDRMTLLGEDRMVDHATQDSREIGPGGVFCATRGSTWDGHVFINKALAAGASVIIAERPPASDDGFDATCATWVTVDDALFALAHVAAAWYGHPGREVRVLATTGTNGKTTTSYLLRQVCDALAIKSGLISTVEILVDQDKSPTIFTTPPSPEFQRLLGEMRERGCTHAIVEASSHGLHQHRIAAFDVAVGGFTNLSRDHLDYHPSMEDYEAAKAILFDTLAETAAINIDAEAGGRMAERFARRAPSRLVTVSPTGRDATLSARASTSTLAGVRATISIAAGATGLREARSVELVSPLIGRHNLENLLVALGMSLLAGFPLEGVLTALASATGAPGRMEPVRVPTDAALPAVFVDYAHTPDALDNALSALRPLVPGRLVCVFGAGGDRDRGKRPEMARAAERWADAVIITSDNPRTEDAERILDDIAAGFGAIDFTRIADRKAAIAAAIQTAGPGDAILIAGKGHEDYQIIGTTKHPFDDRVVARDALLLRGESEVSS